MKIRTYIVDDFEDQYLALENILTAPPFSHLVEIISTWQGNNPYEKAKRDIAEKQPSLLFIDHDLNQGSSKTGLHLFKEIEEKTMFAVFFSYAVDKIIQDANITKYAKYIPKNAYIDPSSKERRLIIEKGKTIVEKDALMNLVTMARQFVDDQNGTQRLSFKTFTSLNTPSSKKPFPLNRIACFESDGNYAQVHEIHNPPPIRIYHSLKQLSDEFAIEQYGFLRVHDEWIVNVELIHEYNATEVKLLGVAEAIPISRKYKKEGVLNLLDDHFKGPNR